MLKQAFYILFFYFTGEFISSFIDGFIPGSVIGMILSVSYTHLITCCSCFDIELIFYS